MTVICLLSVPSAWINLIRNLLMQYDALRWQNWKRETLWYLSSSFLSFSFLPVLLLYFYYTAFFVTIYQSMETKPTDCYCHANIKSWPQIIATTETISLIILNYSIFFCPFSLFFWLAKKMVRDWLYLLCYSLRTSSGVITFDWRSLIDMTFDQNQFWQGDSWVFIVMVTSKCHLTDK